MSIAKKIGLAVFLFSIIFPPTGFCMTDILNIRHWAAPDHTRIVIDTSTEADIRTTKIPGKVTIDLREAQLTEEVPLQTVLNKPGIQKIVVTPLANTNLSIDLFLSGGAEATVFKLNQVQDKPFRIVIDLKFPDIEKKESEERQRFQVSKKDKIIVIDPGHGGEDPGAIGPRKTMEKDVVLKISKKLEWLLNHRKGYRAFLTRNADYYPSFSKRLKIASEYGPDLFVSIHADASRSRLPHGSSVYCLSTNRASSEAARLLARQENLADIIGGSETDQGHEESDPITLHMIQTETINMSKSLGGTVLTNLRSVSSIKFPRIQEAPFIVLKLPHIPSILVETGYITNYKEELLLRDNRHQNRIALALCRSIQQFLRDPEPDNDAIQIAMEEEREQAKDTATTAQPQIETASQPVPRMILYKVRKGEKLESIARKFKTSPAALLKLNKLQKSDSLANRQLKIYLPADSDGSDLPAQPVRPARRAPEDSIKEKPKKPVIHVVKRGENLAGIAQKYRTTVAAIASENGLKPGKPLFVDKRLTIPGAAVPQPGKAVSATPPATPEKPRIHVVKRGETIEKIARKYNTTVADLLKENKMKMRDPLWVDRKIRIPQ